MFYRADGDLVARFDPASTNEGAVVRVRAFEMAHRAFVVHATQHPLGVPCRSCRFVSCCLSEGGEELRERFLAGGLRHRRGLLFAQWMA